MNYITPDLLESIRQRIIQGLREYAKTNGFKKVLVGSSGGIDSAITIALAAAALGAENVTAITMPSEYSSKGSVDDSVTLCANLGVELLTCPIGFSVATVKNAMFDAMEQPVTGVALENLQARMRGMMLMTYSNMNGHLLLTTGNKSEASVGYCTLYGDTCGGLNLIGDLYKTEVFALARHINEVAGRELIPQVIIDKAPSAELAPDQKDDDSLPPYPVLDSALQALQEPVISAARAYEAFYALVPDSERYEVMSRVRQLVARSAFKRLQLPPCVELRELVNNVQ